MSRLAVWLVIISLLGHLKMVMLVEAKNQYVDRIYRHLQEHYPCGPDKEKKHDNR